MVWISEITNTLTGEKKWKKGKLLEGFNGGYFIENYERVYGAGTMNLDDWSPV